MATGAGFVASVETLSVGDAAGLLGAATGERAIGAEGAGRTASATRGFPGSGPDGGLTALGDGVGVKVLGGSEPSTAFPHSVQNFKPTPSLAPQ